MRTRRWPKGHRGPPPKFNGTRDNLHPEAQNVIERLQQDGYRPGPGSEQQEPQAGPQHAQPQPEPEREAAPGRELDVSERIDASIRRIHQAGQRAAADAEAEQHERSSYAARMAQEAQYEAEPAHPWPPSQAEGRSAEMDYEPEL
jgi:hypothetical protein